MKHLPVVGSIVVVNDLPDATFYRVVETDGKFGVGLIDSTIEKQYPNQKVQWIDRGAVKFPTTAQMFSKKRIGIN
jgi:hypothetical protein